MNLQTVVELETWSNSVKDARILQKIQNRDRLQRVNMKFPNFDFAKRSLDHEHRWKGNILDENHF